MVRRRGPRLTLAEKTALWRRWRRGESLKAIGRALGPIAHVVRYECRAWPGRALVLDIPRSPAQRVERALRPPRQPWPRTSLPWRRARFVRPVDPTADEAVIVRLERPRTERPTGAPGRWRRRPPAGNSAPASPLTLQIRSGHTYRRDICLPARVARAPTSRRQISRQLCRAPSTVILGRCSTHKTG